MSQSSSIAAMETRMPQIQKRLSMDDSESREGPRGTKARWGRRRRDASALLPRPVAVCEQGNEPHAVAGARSVGAALRRAQDRLRPRALAAHPRKPKKPAAEAAPTVRKRHDSVTKKIGRAHV